ncbi:MAG: hypothetical protein LBL51_00120 [Synergistaceae bacterium]|jgi:hypothetical protein|nr:hypothetical protein [Synergistaceae bacterium]
MRRFFKALAALVLAAVLCPAPGWASDPWNALSVRADESIYLALRMNDLGGTLRVLLSPSIIEAMTSLAGPEEAQGIRLAASLASQIPAQSVALAAGMTKDKLPFFQMAVSVSPELQPKLKLVAEGKASPEDLITLALGNGALMFAMGFNPSLVQDKAGPYYSIEGLCLSAEGDALLAASSPQDLADSREALKKADKRLAFKRRFQSPNFIAYHIDAVCALAFLEEVSEETGEEALFMKNFAEFFKAPLNIEVDFSSKPGSALMSMAVNLLEAVADVKRFGSIEPLKAGGFFSAGGGKLFFGAAGPYLFRPEEFAGYPGFDEAWEKVLAGLKTVGLDGSDLENLLAGAVTIALGGEAAFMGQTIPGGYIALTGQKDAASKFLRAVVESEPASAASLSPVKAEGWSSLFQVNPALVPVPLLVGVKGETLFAGVLDPKNLNQTPELPPEGRELFGQDTFGAGFIDTAGIWEYLRTAAGNAASPLNSALTLTPEGQNFARLLSVADFPLKFVKMWAPTLETSFLEITAADVPPERNLLFKLAETWASFPGGGNFDDSPLELLLTAKAEIEELLAEEEDLDELDFDGVTLIMTPDGQRLFIGTQVSGVEKKTSLIETAKQFGLKGSAGLNIAPGDSDYAGQEVVWIEIDSPEP